MAGHSQFKNIMHRKGRQDKVKSKLFGKLAREITVAGQARPARSRRAIRGCARRSSRRAPRTSPKDVIERAIKKALGNDAENYEDMRYEGYGPGGVAVIVEALTDNRNRTAGEVRATFTKSGGNLAETGAVSFMFDHVGVVEYDAAAANAEAMLEAAIDAGAEDVQSRRGRPRDLHHRRIRSRDRRQGAGGEVRRAAQGGAGLEAAEHRGDRRRAGREGAAS